eukprot:12240024-Ditylum_brightwellii.AAC.1
MMHRKSNVPNNRGFKLYKEGALSVVTLLEDCDEDEPFIINIAQCVDMVKNSNIAAWLKDHPNWIDPDTASLPMAGKSPHTAACVRSVASTHDSSVATLSTSPDGRVACHKIWGVILDISGTPPLHSAASCGT